MRNVLGVPIWTPITDRSKSVRQYTSRQDSKPRYQTVPAPTIPGYGLVSDNQKILTKWNAHESTRYQPVLITHWIDRPLQICEQQREENWRRYTRYVKNLHGSCLRNVVARVDMTYPCTNRLMTALNRVIRDARRASRILGTYIKDNLKLIGESH
jgi:hypothetical protein